MQQLKLAEVFRSIQGEGRFTRMPSTFVRTTGCNLRCWFCDTPYSSWSPVGQWWSIPDLLRRLVELADVSLMGDHVVVTGGEPLLQPAIVPLTQALVEAGAVVTIETAGTVDRPVAASLMSISPKLGNSAPRAGVWSGEMQAGRSASADSLRWIVRHDAERMQLPVLQRFLDHYPTQLKFVLDQPEDFGEVDELLSRLRGWTPDQVWLMPQGRSAAELSEKAAWITELARSTGFHDCPRLQIEMFGNQPGT